MIQRFARPYAQALLANAAGAEEARAARDDLALFCRALEAVPALGQMARNPAIPMDLKARVLGEVATTLGLGKLVTSFLELLLTHYRLVHAESVLGAVDRIVRRRLGVASARITCAEPLDEGQIARVQAALGRLLDRTVEVEVGVDPGLLAGFVARVESRRYDASLRGQLQRLAMALAEGGEVTGR